MKNSERFSRPIYKNVNLIPVYTGQVYIPFSDKAPRNFPIKDIRKKKIRNTNPAQKKTKAISVYSPEYLVGLICNNFKLKLSSVKKAKNSDYVVVYKSLVSENNFRIYGIWKQFIRQYFGGKLFDFSCIPSINKNVEYIKYTFRFNIEKSDEDLQNLLNDSENYKNRYNEKKQIAKIVNLELSEREIVADLFGDNFSFEENVCMENVHVENVHVENVHVEKRESEK